MKRHEIHREEYQEFLQAYRAEKRNYPSGFVPARVLPLTGLMLYELERAGYITQDGRFSYRPDR